MSFIRLTYRIETPGDLRRMAEKIASDQTTGTFVPVPGETPDLKARCAARVIAIHELEPYAQPTFPQDRVTSADPLPRCSIALPVARSVQTTVTLSAPEPCAAVVWTK